MGRRNPKPFDLVEIWQEVEGSANGLEMHLVRCIGIYREKGRAIGMRYIHSPIGPIGYTSLHKINMIVPISITDPTPMLLWNEFNKKKGKKARYEY